jgi:integrase
MTTLRTAVQEYLTLRRSLGFKLHDAGKGLLAFVTFLEQHRAAYITRQWALTWAQQPSTVQPTEWARRLSFVRGFARHRSATDPRTEIPPDGVLPYRPKRARPYLYTDDEISSLLRAALTLPGRGGLRPWTYHGLFGLLSVSGLRIGEARNLHVDDVDLDTGVLTIRGAKFGKSRLVPLHASSREVLAGYLARRRRHWAGRPVKDDVPPNPVDVRLFCPVAVMTEADRVPDALHQCLRSASRVIVRSVRVDHAAHLFEDRAIGPRSDFTPYSRSVGVGRLLEVRSGCRAR